MFSECVRLPVTLGMMSPHAGSVGATPRPNYQQLPAGQQFQYAQQQQGMGSGASPASGMTPSQHAAAPVRPGMPQHPSGMNFTPGQGMLSPLCLSPASLVSTGAMVQADKGANGS